jgi:hypothetical protein
MDITLQETIALKEAANALRRMIERGVSKKHIPGSALFMVGLMAMETCVQRESIAIWLEELARKYRHTFH